MLLFTVFLPLVNFILFLLFGRLVHTRILTTYVIASMFALLAGLIYSAPEVIEGSFRVASLGV
jgi:hypothetical protein